MHRSLVGDSTSISFLGNEMFKHALAAIVLGPCLAMMAHAIGDSGGCSDFDRQPLGKALKVGTPQEVEAAIQIAVDRNAPRFSPTYSRQTAILDLIQASYKERPPCAPNPLLLYALDAGNVEVVRYLLDAPFGQKIQVPQYVLFHCQTHWDITPEGREARRRAYSVLFDRKVVDVQLLRNGVSVLGRCAEPELVSLYLENGARPDVDVRRATGTVNYLEMAMYDALTFDEDSNTAKDLHALERIRLFSKYMPASIEGRPFQTWNRASCSRIIGGKPWNRKTCEALQTLVRGAPAIDIESSEPPARQGN